MQPPDCVRAGSISVLDASLAVYFVLDALLPPIPCAVLFLLLFLFPVNRKLGKLDVACESSAAVGVGVGVRTAAAAACLVALARQTCRT